MDSVNWHQWMYEESSSRENGPDRHGPDRHSPDLMQSAAVPTETNYIRLVEMFNSNVISLIIERLILY